MQFQGQSQTGFVINKYANYHLLYHRWLPRRTCFYHRLLHQDQQPSTRTTTKFSWGIGLLLRSSRQYGQRTFSLISIKNFVIRTVYVPPHPRFDASRSFSGCSTCCSVPSPVFTWSNSRCFSCAWCLHQRSFLVAFVVGSTALPIYWLRFAFQFRCGQSSFDMPGRLKSKRLLSSIISERATAASRKLIPNFI